MIDLIIQGADVVRCGADSCTVSRDQSITVKGNRIVSVGPSSDRDEEDAREVIRAPGMLAMPGLVNTHSHVPMGIFRGLAEDVDITTWFNEYLWPLESNLTADDVLWGMKLGLVEMIEAGVTSVADHYFHMDRAAEAVEQAGTRAALGWAVFGSQGEYGVRRTSSFAEEYDGAASGRITTWLAPHAPYTCDDDFLSAVAREAERLDLGIHIHAAEAGDQTRARVSGRSDPGGSERRAQPAGARPNGQSRILCPGVRCADGDLRRQGADAGPRAANPRQGRDHRQGGGEHGAAIEESARVEDPALPALGDSPGTDHLVSRLFPPIKACSRDGCTTNT